MYIQPNDIRPNDLGIYRFHVSGLEDVTFYMSFTLPQAGKELRWGGVTFLVTSVNGFTEPTGGYVGVMTCARVHTRRST